MQSKSVSSQDAVHLRLHSFAGLLQLSHHFFFLFASLVLLGAQLRQRRPHRIRWVWCCWVSRFRVLLSVFGWRGKTMNDQASNFISRELRQGKVTTQAFATRCTNMYIRRGIGFMSENGIGIWILIWKCVAPWPLVLHTSLILGSSPVSICTTTSITLTRAAALSLILMNTSPGKILFRISKHAHPHPHK